MSDFNAMVHALKSGQILIPLLKKQLLREARRIEKGTLESKAVVMHDADMTISCFKERKKEYNHREQLDGEFYHPSQLGQCLRKMWFDVKKAPKDGEETAEDLFKSHLVFEMGTYAHVLFQNLCERSGILEQREVAIIDPKNRILGHGDGVLKIGGRRYLLEIKTINARGFTELGAPKDAHKMQMTAYMKSLGLDAAIIIYIDKDGSRVKEFVYDYDAAYWRDVVKARISIFFDSVRDNTMPDREGSNPSKMPCNYCPFRRICFDSEELTEWLEHGCVKLNNNKKPKFKFSF